MLIVSFIDGEGQKAAEFLFPHVASHSIPNDLLLLLPAQSLVSDTGGVCQWFGPRSDVLLLLPHCGWAHAVVEKIHHSSADCAIRRRILHLFKNAEKTVSRKEAVQWERDSNAPCGLQSDNAGRIYKNSHQN